MSITMPMSIVNRYTDDNTRWEAYQFSDPFATASFVCLNPTTNVLCRPNCDASPKVDTSQSVLFYDSIYAIPEHREYALCTTCDPSNHQKALNLHLIKTTIDYIDNSIGFTKDSNDLKRRAYSVPIDGKGGHYNSAERQLTRNEHEHFKLVELACRHIAAAAVENLKKQSFSNSQEENTKKKRRGGVLGFKELAMKSKLSAWHFHRVFRSVTGLTPKNYGDKCTEFVKNKDRPKFRSVGAVPGANSVPIAAGPTKRNYNEFNEEPLSSKRRRRTIAMPTQEYDIEIHKQAIVTAPQHSVQQFVPMLPMSPYPSNEFVPVMMQPPQHQQNPEFQTITADASAPIGPLVYPPSCSNDMLDPISTPPTTTIPTPTSTASTASMYTSDDIPWVINEQIPEEQDVNFSLGMYTTSSQTPTINNTNHIAMASNHASSSSNVSNGYNSPMDSSSCLVQMNNASSSIPLTMPLYSMAGTNLGTTMGYETLNPMADEQNLFNTPIPKFDNEDFLTNYY